MLTTDAFHAWCHRLQLAPGTVERIAAIRSSPPVRTVTGRAGNVTGRYPSPKMQRTIQFESHKVELWAIYTMEHDEQVLEYYDQPRQLELRYQSPTGRPLTVQHTPDFLVLRQDSACFEEWKPEDRLVELAKTQPQRYQRDEDGGECVDHCLGDVNSSKRMSRHFINDGKKGRISRRAVDAGNVWRPRAGSKTMAGGQILTHLVIPPHV